MTQIQSHKFAFQNPSPVFAIFLGPFGYIWPFLRPPNFEDYSTSSFAFQFFCLFQQSFPIKIQKMSSNSAQFPTNNSSSTDSGVCGVQSGCCSSSGSGAEGGGGGGGNGGEEGEKTLEGKLAANEGNGGKSQGANGQSPNLTEIDDANERQGERQKENVKQPNSFGTFSPMMANGSSAQSASMLSNVIGYARTRLFQKAAATNECGDRRQLTATTVAIDGGEQNDNTLGRRQPFANFVGHSESQSARGTPTRKGWEEAQKSCPVPRRQFNNNLAQQQNGSNNGYGTAGIDRRDSLSIGSRESVNSVGRSTVATISGFEPPSPIFSSSRASWQQQQNGGGGKGIGGNRERGGVLEKEGGGEHWQLFAVTLHRASQGGFGIAISGGGGISSSSSLLGENSSSSTAAGSGAGGILVSDVIPSGPAFGLLQVGDRITSCNGYPLEHADYGSAVAVMKEAQQLNMIVKRRVPVPFVEFEQRTLKFTLSKSRKKDDFGIVLGCRFYIKEILNPKLAEKEPGLKEGDTVLRINGQSLECVTLEEASRLLQRSREKLSLVVQRDVRRGNGGNGPGGPGGGGSRWPSQTTVYERLGSLQATPRHSPTPAHYGFGPQSATAMSQIDGGGQYSAMNSPALFGRKGSAGTEYAMMGASGYKRFSDPISSSVRVDYCPMPQTSSTYATGGGGGHYAHPPPQQQQQMPIVVQMQNNGRSVLAPAGIGCVDPSWQQQQPTNSPYLGQQRLVPFVGQQPPPHHQSPATLQTRAHSQTPSSVHSLPIGGPQPTQHVPSNASIHSQTQFGQQPPMEAQSQRFHQPPQQMPSQQGQMMAQQRPIRTVNFQKGPSGLGIRVIGGNQVGIFVSAVQEQSPADQNGIRVGDRIHAVNGVSIAGLTREEAFDILLSLGEQQISLAVENCPEDFAQVKAGKFGDSFYIRTHFAHSKGTPLQKGGGGIGQMAQQPLELSFQPGDIFHVTDTLFGGSPGFWQVTKVYSAVDSEQKPTAGPASGHEPNSGIVPHAKMAEQMMRQQRQAAAEKANGGMNGTGGAGGEQQGGTLSRSLFRKKLSLSSRKFFGGGSGSNNATPSASDPMEEVLSAGSGSGNYAAEMLTPPAYERVALKRPAFHRPVVLFGPLADVARQQLLAQSGLRFGAPLPSTPSANANSELMISSITSERGIRLSSVDAIMAAQKHCVLCVSAGSVERLQLAQYAPIVILIDVDSRNRVRDLRTKAGAQTHSARKLMELAQRIKKQNSHLLTATLDASKEDQWFEALRALIFHLQERRVWMPEFQPEQPLDDMLLFPLQPPGETPTSDGDKSDYGAYEPNGQSLLNNNNNTLPKSAQSFQSGGQNVHQMRTNFHNGIGNSIGGGGGNGPPFLVPNPAYSLARGQQMMGGQSNSMGNDRGGDQSHQQQMPSSARPSPAANQMANSLDSAVHSHSNSARNSPFTQAQSLSLYAPNQQHSARSSPRESKSQLLAQLATELSNTNNSPRIQLQQQQQQ